MYNISDEEIDFLDQKNLVKDTKIVLLIYLTLKVKRRYGGHLGFSVLSGFSKNIQTSDLD